MKIREVMRNAPMVIEDTDTVGNAQRWMTTYRIRHLPVVAHDKLVGLLTENDLLAARARLAGDKGWWKIRIRDVMPATMQTAGPDDSITEVEGRMAMSKLDAFPVVDKGKLVGLITVIDVLDAEVRRAMAGNPAPIAALGRPLTVRPEDALLGAVRLMFEHHVRDLPVVDDTGKIVGMLSVGDIRRKLGDPAQYLASPTAKRYDVQDVMDTRCATVLAGRPLAEVAHYFADDRLDALPIVDETGALVGMITYLDALHALSRA